MNQPVPTFAVVGAVNHGKSSVVSTLAEDDQVRISSMPGETVECQRFAVVDQFVFYDTPGFQNAIEALPQLAAAAQAVDPLSVFRDFLHRHRGGTDFHAECELFRPLVEDGAGILYVVDASEPVLDLHLAEMEILRLTGQPRLAIINRTGTDEHGPEWKRRLGLHFNAVREFNAHRARFEDRLELLETLAGIDQAWKPRLLQAVALYREAWHDRLAEGAEIIVELLLDSLTHRESTPASPGSQHRRQAAAEDLKTRFTAALADRELRAHRALIQLFGHRRVRAEIAETPLIGSDLFSDDTWRAFGLNTRQLITAGAVGGAATGVGVDVLFAGHTLLAGALLGGLTGAAGALALGLRRPELKVTVPGLGSPLHLGGSTLVVGPCTATNFPWILLDRALAVAATVLHRAHARRDVTVLDAARLRTALDQAGLATAQWTSTDRNQAERAFSRIRRGRLDPAERTTLHQLLLHRLLHASRASWPFHPSTPHPDLPKR